MMIASLFAIVASFHPCCGLFPPCRRCCLWLALNLCRDPADVDILMGTFTKSFGAMGGYIAGSREFVDHLRATTHGFLSDNAMSPVVCQQILTAFKVRPTSRMHSISRRLSCACSLVLAALAVRSQSTKAYMAPL